MTPAVPAFVVTGAGTWGRQMADRLLRARAAGRLHAQRIVLVDRDPQRLATLPEGIEGAPAEWADWLDDHLHEVPDAHLVPWHWAPHLATGWLSSALRRAGCAVEPGGVPEPLGLPFETPTASGGRALSYATWACPPSCIEPALCPHTRGAKDWSLAGHLADGARLVLPCLHLVWGVGTIPVRVMLSARDELLAHASHGEPFDAEVATASHCHGVVGRLRITPRSG